MFLSILIPVQIALAPSLGLTLVPNLSILHHYQGLLLVHLPLAWLRLTPTLSSAHIFTSQIECHHCHAKDHIASHYPQCALVIDYEDDNLLENTD